MLQTLQAPTAQTNATNNTALPTEIASAIEQSFTNFAIFKKNFTESALGVFGSGWAWLTYNSTSKGLAIETTPNQDNPISSGLGYSGNTPLVVSHTQPQDSPVFYSYVSIALRGYFVS